MMDQLLQALVTAAPAAVACIVISMLFLRRQKELAAEEHQRMERLTSAFERGQKHRDGLLEQVRDDIREQTHVLRALSGGLGRKA